MNIRLFLFLLLLPLAWGCKSSRSTDGELTASSWRVVEERARKEEMSFRSATFTGKALLNYPEGNMDNLSASYRITIVKDSLIMIRLIKLIEAARIMITPDSIYVQDRINSQLITCDFALAEETVGLPADFGLLQDLLLGHYHPIPENMTVVQRRGNPKIFEGTAAGMSFRYSLDSDLAKPLALLAQDPAQERQVEILYADHQPGPSAAYPNSVSIHVTGSEELSVSLTHRKVTFDEDRSLLSFDVPSGYTRTTCR